MLLAIIGLAAFISTYCGGLLAVGLRDKLHLILGFSAGAVIGVAFFDLLPEAVALAGSGAGAAAAVSWTALGFFIYLVLDRMLPVHAGGARGAIAAPRAHGRVALGAAALCLHSVLDGAAIGVAFHASHAVGVVVAVAVLTHDFSDGINTINIVLRERGDRGVARAWLLVDALAPAAGIASTFLFDLPGDHVGVALALFAGFFFYMGASDLIPESYHAHPKFLTTAMTLAGAAVMYFAKILAA